MKISASLTRKYGPLPVWAWAAIAGAIGAVYWRLRGGGGGPAGDAIAAPAIAYGDEPDYGDTGGTPAGITAGDVSAAGGEELVSLVRNLEGESRARFDAIDNTLGDFGDLLATQPWAAPVETGVDGGGVEAVDPAKPPAVAPAKPKPQGVTWGGRTFTTKAALGQWLNARGASYSAWAKKHAAAAALLKGPAPKPAPKPAVKAPAKPSAQAPARKPAKTGTGAAGARARPVPKPKPKPARPRGGGGKAGVAL